MFTSRSYGARPETSRPSSRIRPCVGRSKPAIIRRQVVLPEPDGPSMEKNSPSANVQVDAVDRREVAEPLHHAVHPDGAHRRPPEHASRVSLAASATPPPRRAGPGSLDEPILTADEGRGKEALRVLMPWRAPGRVGRPAAQIADHAGAPVHERGVDLHGGRTGLEAGTHVLGGGDPAAGVDRQPRGGAYLRHHPGRRRGQVASGQAAHAHGEARLFVRAWCWHT